MWVFYGFLHAALHEWLYGSVLLTFMLLVLWGRGKWRPLNWISRTRNRWLLLWGVYGLLRDLALGVLVPFVFFREEGGLDGLSWSQWLLASTLHLDYSRDGLLLAVFLSAIIAGAIDLGFAGLSWWISRWFARQRQISGKVLQLERYCVSIVFSACVLGVANQLNFNRNVNCFDCVLPYGFPFTFVKEGGFASIEVFLWRGVLGDSLLVIFLGAVFGWIWSKLSERASNQQLAENQDRVS